MDKETTYRALAAASSVKRTTITCTEAHRMAVYRGAMSGRYMPFEGRPAIPYPQIGYTYDCFVEDFGVVNTESSRRPMILVGYYEHEGKVVACDFISPTSRRPRDMRYDSDRYNIFIEDIEFSNFGRKSQIHVGCSNIITLPNNPDIIVSNAKDKKFMPYLADYLLRRAVTFYDGKARWKKDALIPGGAVRHGFCFEGLDRDLFQVKDRFSPDLPHPDHVFTQGNPGTMPKFACEAMPNILTWATQMHRINEITGKLVDLPDLRQFPNWPTPASLVTSPDDQWKCARVLSQEATPSLP